MGSEVICVEEVTNVIVADDGLTESMDEAVTVAVFVVSDDEIVVKLVVWVDSAAVIVTKM